MPTVIPAYGRDYRNKAQAIADWEAGKDFILQDISSPWDGKPINKEDAVRAGFREVNIRFKNMRQIAVVKVAAVTKIASPQDLQAEIRKIMAYSEGEKPSREALANSLYQLADRLSPARKPKLAADPNRDLAERLDSGLRTFTRGKQSEMVEYVSEVLKAWAMTHGLKDLLRGNTKMIAEDLLYNAWQVRSKVIPREVLRVLEQYNISSR